MVVSIDKATQAILTYMEQEIARKVIGWKKFAAYYVIGSLSAQSNKLFAALQENEIVKMLDVFDEHGNIKIDEVYTAAKAAMDKSGTVTLYGLIFNSDDIETLYKYMRN